MRRTPVVKEQVDEDKPGKGPKIIQRDVGVIKKSQEKRLTQGWQAQPCHRLQRDHLQSGLKSSH